MAISGSDLTSPTGNFTVQMFPELDDVDDPEAFESLMDEFANGANAKAATLVLSTPTVTDKAALAWANYRVYSRILDNILTAPAEMDHEGHVRGAFLAAQMTMIRDKVAEYLGEFNDIVAADQTAIEAITQIPPTTMVPHRVIW